MQQKLLDPAFDPTRNYMNNFQVSWVYAYGYEGDYAVSSIGDVYSFKSQKLLKQRISGNTKYLKVDLYKNGKRHTISVHQLIWESFHNRRVPPGYEIDHINGCRYENYLANLQLLSHEDHQLKHQEIHITMLTMNYPFRKDFTNALQLKKFGFTVKEVTDFVNYNHGYDPFHYYYFMIRA